MTVSPTTATVPLGGNQQFTATVANTTNTAVTWSLTGSGCSGTSCGTITTAGLYTAPASVPSPAQVTVKATSMADPTRSGSAVGDGKPAGRYKCLSDGGHSYRRDPEAIHRNCCEYDEYRCDVEPYGFRLQRGKLRNDYKRRPLYRARIRTQSCPGLGGRKVGRRSDKNQHGDGHDCSPGFRGGLSGGCASCHGNSAAIHGYGEEFDQHGCDLECQRQLQRSGVRHDYERRSIQGAGCSSQSCAGCRHSDVGSRPHQVRYGVGNDRTPGRSDDFADDSKRGRWRQPAVPRDGKRQQQYRSDVECER